MTWKSTKKWMSDGFDWYWIRFKRTKVWKLWTFSFFMVLFLGISRGQFNFWFYLACLFAIYPILLFIILFAYAWVLNPIREAFPNSKFTKKFLKKLDTFLLEVDSFR